LRDVPSSEVEHFDLPRSLRPGEARGTQKARFVAGAPKDGAEEKAGHSGRDDGVGKSEAKLRRQGHLKVAATGRRGTQEGGASSAPTKGEGARPVKPFGVQNAHLGRRPLQVEEPVVGVRGAAGLDGG